MTESRPMFGRAAARGWRRFWCAAGLACAAAWPLSLWAQAPPECACVSNRTGIDISYSITWGSAPAESVLTPNGSSSAFCLTPNRADSVIPPLSLRVDVDLTGAPALINYRLQPSPATSTECAGVAPASLYHFAYTPDSNQQRLRLMVGAAPALPPAPPAAAASPPPKPSAEPEPRLAGSGGRP